MSALQTCLKRMKCVQEADTSREEVGAMDTKHLMKHVRVHLGTTKTEDIAGNIACESGGRTKDVRLGALGIISRLSGYPYGP